MARILIVDDEKSIRRTLGEFLRVDGHEVFEAEDAETALQRMREAEFDVVVTDIILPRVTGVELLRRIHATAPHVQVVMMTGEPTVETASESLRAGAADYVFKPINKEAILRVAANVVKLKALEDSKRRLEAENRAQRENLERLVAERTAELEAVNKSLASSRLDALKLVEDAEAARERAEQTSAALQREVSGRKRAEGALGESEGRYRSLFEHMLEGFAYCQMLFEGGQPRDFVYLEVNATFEALTGLKNVAGKRATEVIPGIREADPGLFEIYGRVAWTGVPERFETYVQALQMWFAISVYSPAQEHFVAVFDVITARKQAEEALRESEERFRLAVAASPFPILLHAEDGAIIHVNQSWCDITGYPTEELKTIADWTERAYGERKNLVQSDIEALYGMEHRKHEGDYTIRTKDGTTRVWEFSSAPLGRLPDGRRLVISMAMDVTERRKAEAEVRQFNVELEERVRQRTAQLEMTNKELEAFSYSVSHDLRAPLRAVDGFARILAMDHTERLDAEGLQVLGVIRSEATRMGQLIDDLLAFSRMGRRHMASSTIDMTALAGRVYEGCAAPVSGRNLQLKMTSLHPAIGDDAMIRQVLANLLANAIKYSRGREIAEIEVGSRVEGQENVYWVKDNGAGFDMRYAGKLFGIFQRLHTEEEFEGTGVGLALVQRIIHRHGGRVWAESKLNEGAVFYFTLSNQEL